MDYTVKSGDSLARIARRHGVSSWGTLYNAPENANFRQLRPDPNKIMPGDRLFIPEPKTPTAAQSQVAGPTQKGAPKPVQGNVSQGLVRTSTGTVIHTNVPTRSSNQNPPPLRLTTQDVLTGKADYPDAFLNFLGEICGGRRFQLNEAVEAAEMARANAEKLSGRGRSYVYTAAAAVENHAGLIRKAVNTMDAAEGVVLLYKAWKGWSTGEAPRESMVDTLKGLSKFWNFIPAGARHGAVQSTAGIISRVDKLRPLAGLVREFEAMNAMPDLLSLLASTVALSPDAMAADCRNIIHQLSRNKHVATRVAPQLTAFAVGLIPVHMRAKLLAKAGVRKVPVIGTAVMAVADIVDIVSEHMDEDPSHQAGHGYALASKYAGLGSTLAGLIPGFGTAASVVGDFVSLMLVAISEVRNLQLQITPLR